MKQVKKMSDNMMKTTRSTATGEYRMWRSGGDVIIQLQPNIGGENVVGWKYTVGRMKDCGMDYKTHPAYPTKTWVFNASWSKTESAGEYTKEYTFTREADMKDNVRAASTKAALNAFVDSYDQFFYDTLLEYEGEVFNPITMETRLHYHSSWNTPLEETWIRLTDDEQTLRNQCDDSFKALAGAILPVKAWSLSKSDERPQRHIRAIIDLDDTKPFGLSSGVGLMPHCWEIITVDDPSHPKNEDPNNPTTYCFVCESTPNEEGYCPIAMKTEEEYQAERDASEDGMTEVCTNNSQISAGGNHLRPPPAEEADDAHWENLHDEQPERFDENGIYHPEPVVSPEQRAMNDLKREIELDRAKLRHILEQVNQLTTDAVEMQGRLFINEQQYAKHSHLDKEASE